MRREPIDYNNPLGISKREWTMVLGVNLAILVGAYLVAVIFTMAGSPAFLLNFNSEALDSIESTLRGWGIYPVLQILFSAVEATILAAYASQKKVKWYFVIGFIAVRIITNVVFTQTLGYYPTFIPILIELAFVLLLAGLSFKTKGWKRVSIRFLVGFVVALVFNVLISLFRMKVIEFHLTNIQLSVDLALNIEGDLALGLTLGFLTMVANNREKGDEVCPTNRVASGSSPTTTNCSPKPLKTKRNNLPPKIARKLRVMKIKVAVLQTVALFVIAALPFFTGRAIEFSLCYISFCATRFVLGFSRSLHFKSEMMCITIGALTFWGITYLAPSAEASIIISLVYGAGLALGFRLYWELHDLMMYRKAAKTDRYAMFYTAFKGDISPKHINGVMRAKGITDKDEIEMVQMYMQRLKVEYIADYMNFARITIEKHLTELAERLYEKR